MLVDGVNVIHKQFIDELIKNAKDVKQLDGIVIFGSSVREDCTAKSDVDIIFISQVGFENREYSLAILNLLNKCHMVEMLPVDMLEMRSISDLEDGTSYFCECVREDGYKYYNLRG